MLFGATSEKKAHVVASSFDHVYQLIQEASYFVCFFRLATIMLEVVPSSIEFRDVVQGKVYHCQLTVKNRSHSLKKIRIRAPANEVLRSLKCLPLTCPNCAFMLPWLSGYTNTSQGKKGGGCITSVP